MHSRLDGSVVSVCPFHAFGTGYQLRKISPQCLWHPMVSVRVVQQQRIVIYANLVCIAEVQLTLLLCDSGQFVASSFEHTCQKMLVDRKRVRLVSSLFDAKNRAHTPVRWKAGAL